MSLVHIDSYGLIQNSNVQNQNHLHGKSRCKKNYPSDTHQMHIKRAICVYQSAGTHIIKRFGGRTVKMWWEELAARLQQLNQLREIMPNIPPHGRTFYVPYSNSSAPPPTLCMKEDYRCKMLVLQSTNIRFQQQDQQK